MFATIRREIRERGEWRMGRWGTFWHRFALAGWGWSVKLCKLNDHWSLHLFCLWVRLWVARTPPEEMMDSWGFGYYPDERALHLNWGRRYKIVRMPWAFDHHRMEVMLKDGRFVPWEPYARGSLARVPEPAGRYRQVFPYRYTLRSGEAQDRLATVTVERRSWCWRAWPFSALRWPSQTSTCIDVEFSDEVGERTGSWKGGCVGCGYELRPGESPEACLRRMERERTFD